MPSPPRLADVSLALDVIATPLVLEVLDGAGRGLAPTYAVLEGADPNLVEAAVRFLRQLDLVDVGAEADVSSSPRRVILTPKGRRLLAALTEFDAPVD